MRPASLPPVVRRRALRRAGFVVLIGFALAGSVVAGAAERLRLAWNSGWSFHAGDIVGAPADFSAASAWRPVTLPHDWSIEGVVDEQAPAAGHGGYFPTGTGWYRREFSMPPAWRGRRVVVEFEGAYMNSEVWLNGVPLARQPYGYTPIVVDLTPHLRADSTNTLAVRVDNSAQPNSRWYSGSGLYRPVWLHVTAPCHVALDGTFPVTRALNADRAELSVETLVENTGADEARIALELALRAPDGRVVARGRAAGRVPAGGSRAFVTALTVPDPQPWSPGSPVLYTLATRLAQDDRTVDTTATPVGLRTVRVSAAGGFELNGRPVELNGGNVHHDTGPLGAAAFARAEERKVELLKAAGFNAVRTAHNPPSRAFLEACDRLGLLVMDEIFDGWAAKKNKHDYGVHFARWWQHDLDAWVRRDRRHPSVVMWSVGNEMFERANAEGRRIAQELAARVRTWDDSRPVTAGVNGAGKTTPWDVLDGLFAAFDVAGYNYELTRHAEDHARLPGRVIVAAESYQSEVFANWAASQDHAHVIGDFVWSALDYLGEAGIGRVFPPGQPVVKHWEGPMWPWHGALCGDTDLIGRRKPISHYRSVVWDTGEKLYAAVAVPAPDGGAWNVSPWTVPPTFASWTWPGHEGRALAVEVYSRHEAVRLLLNGRTIGEAPTGRAQEFKAVFQVPYAPGELVAVGLRDGREVGRFTLRTAGPAQALRLRVDRALLRADAQDLAFIDIEAVDAAGRWQPLDRSLVRVAVEGAGELAALGSGDLSERTSYRSTARPLHEGRALAVVRTTGRAGGIRVRVEAPGLKPAEVRLLTSHR